MKDFVPPMYTPRKTLMERLEDALLPLINLVFLLLMFFIVAGQLQNRSLPPLPGTVAKQSAAENQGREADLVVLSSGEWQIEGKKVDTSDLASALPANGNRTSLTVGTDAGTRMSDLEQLFGLLAQAGYQDVVLLTEPSRP